MRIDPWYPRAPSPVVSVVLSVLAPAPAFDREVDCAGPARCVWCVWCCAARMLRAAAAAFGLFACGCAASSRNVAVPATPATIEAEPRIVTTDEVVTERELADRAGRALVEHRWRDAAAAYRTLLAADPSRHDAPELLFQLGLACEGAQDRTEARDAYVELVRRFGERPTARRALVRIATLDAYLEDWTALESTGEVLLARPDLEDVERLIALGARGLARVEHGDDAGASSDIYDGLDLADELHYGPRDVLPVAVAQVRFALGELRRIRSERIRLDPLPVDFLDQLEVRCAGLLQAQAAYAIAVRSVDPHWAAMAGYRVGAMYRALHRELTTIPPPPTVKTDRQRQIFFAFMHVRYRVLLEKGLREMDQTIALGERTSDGSTWILRATQAREDMQAALTDERARLEAMPFTEAEVRTALDLLTRRAMDRARAAAAIKRGITEAPVSSPQNRPGLD